MSNPNFYESSNNLNKKKLKKKKESVQLFSAGDEGLNERIEQLTLHNSGSSSSMKGISKKSQHIPTSKPENEIPLELIHGLYSQDEDALLEAANIFRRLTSQGSLIEEIVRIGVIPQFVYLMATMHSFPEFQLEAAWFLSNLVCKNYDTSKVVIDSGAVPAFVQLLSSSTDYVREQAVFALDNISCQFRQTVIDHGAVPLLFAQINEKSKFSMLRIATSTIAMLLWGDEPQPPFDKKPSGMRYTLTKSCNLCYLAELLLHPTPTKYHISKLGGFGDFGGNNDRVRPDILKPYLVILKTLKSVTKVMRVANDLTLDEIHELIMEQTQYHPVFSGESEEGYVVGRLLFGDARCNFIDCRDGTTTIISSKINEVFDMKSDALFILLVDNDTVYSKLREDRFYNRYPCIIVKLTGKLDISTWLFVWKLKIDLKLPVIAFVDCYPKSLKNLCVYASKNLLYDVKWLGIRPSEWDNYGIPERFREPLTEKDITTCKLLLKSDFIKNNRDRVKELKLMVKLKQKVQSDALGFLGIHFITDYYLPMMLQDLNWI